MYDDVMISYMCVSFKAQRLLFSWQLYGQLYLAQKVSGWNPLEDLQFSVYMNLWLLWFKRIITFKIIWPTRVKVKLKMQTLFIFMILSRNFSVCGNIYWSICHILKHLRQLKVNHIYVCVTKVNSEKCYVQQFKRHLKRISNILHI